jgi:hypothetical protein
MHAALQDAAPGLAHRSQTSILVPDAHTCSRWFRPAASLAYEHMFPWTPRAALAGHPASRRALTAARFALSVLLLEDDHEVDWEVDWDQSAGFEPRPAERAAPRYCARPGGRRASVGRGYRGHASRRQGQPAPRLHPCAVDVGPPSPTWARTRRRCEAPASATRLCRSEAGVSQTGRRDRGARR